MTRPTPEHRAWGLFVALLLTVVLRLPSLNAPIADHLHAKQAYTALRVRAIAEPPFDPFRSTLKLLDAQGRPMRLVEEVPIYATLVALLQRTVGSLPAAGRALSIAGSLLAVTAFFMLVGRAWGPTAAFVGSVLFTAAPLFLFYGRAVMPDSGMLGLMLATADLHDRYRRGGRPWYAVGAIACGAAAALFKYYGLMIVVVLAWSTFRDPSTVPRARSVGRFLGLTALLALPVSLWMVLVFFQMPNPVVTGWVLGTDARPYLVFQNPAVLGEAAFYCGFWRFLSRDLGPVSLLLLLFGVAASTGRRRVGPRIDPLLVGWTLLGGLFYVLLGPKLVDHDYYELMMLPAGALWATRGWLVLCDGLARRREWLRTPWLGRLILGLAVSIQWMQSLAGPFQVEPGKVALAGALETAVPPSGRVLLVGSSVGLVASLVASDREGWTVPSAQIDPAGWSNLIAGARAHRANALALYFDRRMPAAERETFEQLVQGLPERARGASEPGGKPANQYEYRIFELAKPDGTRPSERGEPAGGGPLDTARAITGARL